VLEAIELIRRDDNSRVFPVQRNTLRSDALGLSDNLA
jgi:hypothetical protein